MVPKIVKNDIIWYVNSIKNQYICTNMKNGNDFDSQK